MALHSLPFKAGQVVESRSFLAGFRGAWFRCKINDIGWRMGQISSALEYFDFPDEKVTWIKIYQTSHDDSKRSRKSRKLMLRPRFPPIYHKSTMPDVNTIAEVVVIVDGVWKVGDLVDWWKDGCYWSGRVTEILGNEKVKIELPPPPVGEGYSYEVSSKDLRPSLDWSPENGWTSPTTMESENGHPCVQVMKPGNEGGIPSLAPHSVGDGIRDVQPLDGLLPSFSSHVSASSVQPLDGLQKMEKQRFGAITAKETSIPETNLDSDMLDSGIGKTSCSDSVSSSHLKNSSKGMRRTINGEDRVEHNGSLKKMKTDGSIVLNSMSSDTLESAILDLEELVNRVKWMKDVLEIGIPLTRAMRPSWKFL